MKIIHILLFLAVISIQPIVVSGGWLNERGKEDQFSTKVGFVYRNVVFEKHPLKAKFEGEIKKLQQECDDFHKDLMNNPEMKKTMIEVQGLVDELQLLKQGTKEYKKKEEEISDKKMMFSKYLESATEKEGAIAAKQQEFYRRFEGDLEETVLEIGKEKNLLAVISVLARGYDGHGHGNQAEPVPSYNYFVYKKEGMEMLDLTKEVIHKLEIMYKFRKIDN